MNSNFTDFNTLFSYNEAEENYKNLKINCKYDIDCPGDFLCHVDHCELFIDCYEKDLSRCTGSHNTTFKVECSSDEECLSNKCIDNKCIGRNVYCIIGNNEAKCGLDIGETCTKDNECYEQNCKNGICEKNNMSNDIDKICIMASIPIIIILILFWACCCYKRESPNKN